MKNLFKISTYLLIFALLSCQTNEDFPDKLDNPGKLHNGDRVLGTSVTLNTPYTVTGVWIVDTLIFENGGELTVASGGQFHANWVKNKVNHIGRAKISISSGGLGSIYYILSAGNMGISNLGTLNLAEFRSYHNDASITNYGTISSDGAGFFMYAGKIFNQGTITHSPGSNGTGVYLTGTGKYETAVCGKLITTAWENDVANAVIGNGRIKVEGQAILNQSLTTSSGIRFCAVFGYGGTPSSNTGSATIDCNQSSCF